MRSIAGICDISLFAEFALYAILRFIATGADLSTPGLGYRAEFPVFSLMNSEFAHRDEFAGDSAHR
jgi:hypothetical protein